MRKDSGFTLLEIMVSMTILTLIVMVLMVLGMSMSQAVLMQDARTSTRTEALQGMTRLVRELRMASAASIDWQTLPSTSIRYRVPTDLDGNGSPVDMGGFVELGNEITVGPDTEDLNRDGIRLTQLVWSDGEQVKILANNLVPTEDVNSDGTMGPGEDTNHNGELDAGVLFERADNGIQVTIRTARRPAPRSQMVFAELTEVVVPRNGG